VGIPGAGGFGAGGSGGWSSGGYGNAGNGNGGSGGGGGVQEGAHAPDPRSEPPTFCTRDGWCGSNADFVAISGTSETDIWIVANDTGSLSDAGAPTDPLVPIAAEPLRTAVLHWDGFVWTAMQPDPKFAPLGIGLRSIGAAAADDVWVVGDGGTSLAFDGVSWGWGEGLAVAPNVTAIAKRGTDTWIVGDGPGFFWHGPDGVLVSPTIPSEAGLTAISAFEGGFWGVGPEIVGRYDGAYWTVEQNLVGLTAIWAPHGDAAFAVGGAGALARTGDDGTWLHEEAEDFTFNDWRAVWGRSAGDVWAVGESGIVAHFDGDTWKGGSSVTPEQLNGIWGTSDHTWVVGDDGTFLSLEGDTWTSSQATSESLRALWGSAEDDVWAAGNDLVHFDGSGWVQMPRPDVPELLALSGTGRNDVWAVGREGIAAHFDGEFWTMLPIPTTFDVNGVWAHTATEAWAVSQDGISWLTLGADWSGSAPPVAPALKGVFGNVVGDLVVAGEGRRTVRTGLVTFDVPAPADGAIYSVVFGDGKHIWTGGWYGPTGPHAATQHPLLGRWDGDVMVDGFEPGAEFELEANAIQTGWARSIPDVWIACPSVMHWDGMRWRYSSVGGSEKVIALYGAGQDLWAITAEGNLVRRRLGPL